MNAKVKKHPCADCRQCQWCSDERCRLCLKSTSGCRKKLSMADQIALYEQLNQHTQNPAFKPSLLNQGSRPKKD